MQYLYIYIDVCAHMYKCLCSMELCMLCQAQPQNASTGEGTPPGKVKKFIRGLGG